MIGVRIAYQPKDISTLFTEYKEAFVAARTVEQLGEENVSALDKKPTLNLFPKNLSDFLEKRLHTYFGIKSYVLNPLKIQDEPPQPTPFSMECFTENPLKEIIRVDMIDAQRGFTDPDSTIGGEANGKQLSSKMRQYYDKHLDPEKMPTAEDLTILQVTENAKMVFDKSLSQKFTPAIQELETLGYPGIADPQITIASQVSTSETLRHESAVQYSLSRTNPEMKLPEKYNGLGYQNLISMVFDFMSFRDAWMRVGKATKEQSASAETIKPLHLVIVEEPEAHLHMQVQQVFIRKAYSVLRNCKFLKENPTFETQLVISTHSSHIALETNFANLRYFKRVSASLENEIATAKVINLSDVFGKEDVTDKFVTRYLQTTHCDLFFADAAILVEGAAESMLIPHFIRTKYDKLAQRYISILSINGKHSHRLAPLIDKLCLPTLVITDLDSALANGHHSAAEPVIGKSLISSNFAITGWLIKEKLLDKLIAIPFDNKVFWNNTPYRYPICIAFQTPIEMELYGVKIQALSSTFEDCLVYTNYNLFKGITSDDIGGLVAAVHNAINSAKSFDELHTKIYTTLRKGKSDQKAEFALDVIYLIDPNRLTVPNYVAEGLSWLQNLLYPEE